MTNTTTDAAEARALEWRCFHCGDVFTNERSARLHFGRDEESQPACLIKAGAEQGLLGALREAEYAAADARHAIADESTEASKAYYAQATRHAAALRNAEEAGYERGLADARRATAEAASGAGEREDEVQRLKAEVDRWRHKLWMIACHATGGNMPDIEGIDQSTNDISVQITALRNAIYQAGKDAALASLPTATDPAMVTVPREPTEAMMRAVEAVNFETDDEHAMGCNVWQAMIAAAPTIPATGHAATEGEGA